MSETFIIAILSLTGSGFGTLTGIVISSKLTNYRIEQLEKKVDKHNSVIERMFKVEKDVCVLENKSKVSEHRLDDLERVKCS